MITVTVRFAAFSSVLHTGVAQLVGLKMTPTLAELCDVCGFEVVENAAPTAIAGKVPPELERSLGNELSFLEQAVSLGWPSWDGPINVSRQVGTSLRSLSDMVPALADVVIDVEGTPDADRRDAVERDARPALFDNPVRISRPVRVRALPPPVYVHRRSKDASQ